MTALLSQRQGRGLGRGRGRVRRNQFLVVLIASVLWHEIGALSYSIGSNSKSLLIDGGAYATFKQYPQSFTGADDNSIGQLTYTIGYSVDGNNDRVLAVPVNPNDDNAKEVEDILVNRNVVRVYKDTICKIENEMKDWKDDILLDTALSCLPLYFALQQQQQQQQQQTAVVLGSGEHAQYLARALSLLDVKTFLVSTKGANSINIPNVSTMDANDDEPFCETIGQFDALIDTIGDERNAGSRDDDSGNFDNVNGIEVLDNLGVVKNLKFEHSCEHYISTFSRGARIVKDNGAFFGPNKVKQYQRFMYQRFTSGNLKIIIPPADYASLVIQPLMKHSSSIAGYTFPKPLHISESVCMRGWSFADFLEHSSWPREAEGNSFARYGMPVSISLEKIVDYAPNSAVETTRPVSNTPRKPQQKLVEKQNPFVDYIGDSLEDLHNHIILPKKDAVVFLSAPFCRTCKSVYPHFTRLARDDTEEVDAKLKFAKIDAVGKTGRDMGKALGVNAVPSFVMFRDGKKYGEVISVGRLPSKKLSTAINFLRSGLEWDSSAIQKASSS